MKRAGAGGALAQTTNQIQGAQKWWALATVMLTMFFSSMDQTVVSTAIPTIIGDLHGFSLYAWVSTSYMMASAISVPIYGKLSDVYGRKPFYLFGLIVFGVGSAISGMSHTMMELIISRGFQGIGAGAMMSMPRATIGDIFTPKERGRWMGVIGAVFGVASIIGPTLGGFITDTWSWRWVFYVNLPFAVLAILGVIFFLPTVRMARTVKVDWWGSSVLILGLIPILLGFTWAGSQYPWLSPQEFTLFGSGILILAVFVLIERRVAEPVMAPALFRNRIFSMSLLLGVLVSMAMFGSLMFLPLFVQGVIGLNAQQSGWVMSPMMVSFIVGSIVSGQLMTRSGRYKRLGILSAAVIVVGSFLLTNLGVATGFGTVVIDMVVLGLGIGSLMPLLSVAVQNAFPYEMMGTVNSSQQFVSSLGGVIAAPIFGTILNQGFQSKLTAVLPVGLKRLTSGAGALNPQELLTAQAQAAIAVQFARFGAAGHTLYLQLLNAVKVSLTAGVSRLFVVGLLFAVLCFLGTFFLPEVKLKGSDYFASESPLQDALQDALPDPDSELAQVQ